ncbi:hypothetical protein [Curtobacterium sp. MCSS17_016]|uniref:hypothetical protein n=1 Tax=Curtobacterium sp. MCSS17_016 TaxID=2175644 RepID=UPI000DA81101|nr:hypothetical protein [Curtobacterium sp. MCSS17_016]WIE81179.1 hypothetical protein DEJ19_018270 [Curtobacterium sp. MCSS17_016]
MSTHAYEAEIEIPGPNDLEEFIEALRQYGHPRLIVRIRADNKAEAASLLAESSTSAGMPGLDYGQEQWHERLTRIGSADARRRAGNSIGGDQER